MPGLDDSRWGNLTGGYRTRFDPRPVLARLETEQDTATTWHELWDELHHQGDVGDASYAAIPHLVKIHRRRGIVDWNTYALVAIIELARTEKQNPGLPAWLEEDYFHAIRELAEIGAAEVLRAEEAETVRAILSVVAIAKGLRTHGKFLVEYSEDELLEIESHEQ
ncbi:MAG: hypothetical protein WAK89_04705 [Candidatus Sulfotelmatobacter sp.]